MQGGNRKSIVMGTRAEVSALTALPVAGPARIEKKFLTKRSHSAERRRVGETTKMVAAGWVRAK